MRTLVLNAIENVVGFRPEEHDKLVDVMLDDVDFIEAVSECEEELNGLLVNNAIDMGGKTALDFDTVGDFIDWILLFIEP